MTVKDVEKIFEDCDFHIVDTIHQEDMGESNLTYIIDQTSWNNATLEFFDKEVNCCHLSDLYA